MKLKTLIYIFTVTLVFFFGIFIFSSLATARDAFSRNQLNLQKVNQLYELTQTFQASLLSHRLKKFSLISDYITRDRISNAEENLRRSMQSLISAPEEEDNDDPMTEKARSLFDKTAMVVYQLIRNDNLEISAAGRDIHNQLNINSASYINELNNLYFMYAYDTTFSDTHSYLFIESIRVNNRMDLTLTELVDQIVDLKRNASDRKHTYLKAIELIGVLDSLRARLGFIISTEPSYSSVDITRVRRLIDMLSKEHMLKFAAFLTDSLDEPTESELDNYYAYSLQLRQLSSEFIEDSFAQEKQNLKQKIYASQAQLYGMISLSWLLALFIIMPVLIFASKITAWLTLTNKNIIKLSRGDLSIQPDATMVTGELLAISNAINQLRLDQIEKRQLEADKQTLIDELLNSSFIDPLTNIYNRRKFFNECSQIPLQRYPLVFCLIDIDNFKQLNDRYGHDVGDQALIAFSHTLTTVLGEDAVYCRYGGEEFAIVAPSASSQEALQRIDHLRTQTELLRIGTSRGGEIGFTISCGIANIISYATINLAIKQADEALYFSKKSGKNRVSFYQNDGFVFLQTR